VNDSGASATFPFGIRNATVSTNANGVATAPPLTANTATGSFTVTATVAGVVAPATYYLTVTSASIMATGADTGGGPEVKVFDATTHQLKLDFFAFNPGFSGGVRVAVGDVTGDGVPEIICAAGPGGGPQVNVYSSVDGSLLYSFFAYDPSFAGGVYVAAGDLSGTGVDDIICGAGAGGGPNVSVFDGRNQTQLMSFFAYNPAFAGGVRVAAGDMTGSGHANIITGAGAGGGPNVSIWDGVSGTQVASFFAFNPNFAAGIYVAVTRINGQAAVIASAGAGGGPAVAVFTNVVGSNPTQLLGFFAYDAAFTGGVRVAGINATGEILTVPGPGGGPQVNTFSGVDGTAIDSFFAYNLSFAGGVFVAAGD
jgi:hypothetical protein